MTQALLNNLNIKLDDKFNSSDKSKKSVGMDFANVLSKNSSSKNQKNHTDTNKSSDKTNTNDNNGTKDLLFTGSVLNQPANENKTENSEVQENENLTQDNENTELQIVITENVILTEEEEPTMNKALHTLENPAVFYIIQQQIQQNIKNNSDDETDEVEDTDFFACAKQNTNDTTNSSTLPKNVIDISKNVKDSNVINITSKENLHSKEKSENFSKVIDEKLIEDLNVESIKTDGANMDNFSSNEFLQNSTPQEQAAKVLLQGDLKTESYIEINKQVQVKPTEISSHKLIEQISNQLGKITNNSKVDIVLNPESLGKINLQILNSKEGLSALFTVSTNEIKDILLKGLSGLKENLLAHGINVENITVRLKETSDTEYNPDWTDQEGSKGGNKQQQQTKKQKEEKPFEQMMFELDDNDKV